MDNLPPDLDRLFDLTEANDHYRSEEEYPQIPKHTSMLRCKCGHLVSVSIPARCEGCQECKSFWTMIDGKIIKLSEMRLDHLTSCIKMLSEKCESYPQEMRGKFEIALDIMYIELGSREKEISQSRGILNALRRSLDAK